MQMLFTIKVFPWLNLVDMKMLFKSYDSAIEIDPKNVDALYSMRIVIF